MTSNKRAKRNARERQQRTGERYVAARRRNASNDRYFEADCCANCLERLPDETEGLFCSELCMQTADTVRYWRRVLRDARIRDPEVREALRTRVAFLLAGGYGRASRRLSRAVREQVWERDGGACRRCGRPGQEIDHIESSSAALDNLQLLCRDCHHAKTKERMRPTSEAEKNFVDALFATRVEPEIPALLADDEIRWKLEWRGLKKARRERLLDELRVVDLNPADFRGAGRAEIIEALFDARADESDLGGWTEGDDSGYGQYSYFAHAMAKED